MKRILVCLMGIFLSTQLWANTPSDLYYEIGRFSATPIVDPLEGGQVPVMGHCGEGHKASPSDVGGELDNVSVIIDKIINIGKKVWGVVEMGRPVFNIKTDIAHALPEGISCWSDLENWQAPKSKAWRISYENKLGDKVVEFVYRVSYISGGQYHGMGHYITQATISPAELYVAWGYKFNVTASVPSVFNMGTTSDPVAGLQMNIKWDVDTPLVHLETEDQFFVNGLGAFQKMQNIEIQK